MKNNLKIEANYEIQNQLVYEEVNEKFNSIKPNKKEQEYNIYDYMLTSIEVCNQDKIPPKNSLAELVYHEKIDELKTKIKKGKGKVDLDARDNIGATASWTPLYWGVKFQKVDCVRLLLDSGANINTVVNDLEECCGTVLDLAILRGDSEMETLLREFAEKEEVNLNVTFKAIRTKLRGKAPAFNFNSYGKKSN